jgi:uncharacterized membrane protein (DUF485 family)
MSDIQTVLADRENATYREVQQSQDFQDLRRRFRRFVFPMTGLFLAWYFAYVLLADYAHGFMSTKVVGHINIALLMGFGQFASTFLITLRYVRWSAREIDPAAERMRELIEGEAR